MGRKAIWTIFDYSQLAAREFSADDIGVSVMALRSTVFGAGFLVLAALLVVVSVRAMSSMSKPVSNTVVHTHDGQAMLPIQTIHIKGLSVQAEVATTREQKSEGLSGRESLAEGSGMLFVFNALSTDGFWMKDMRFSLDIVWADRDGLIQTIFENISPDTYPQIFKPHNPSRYVLELPAGYIAKHQIALGDKIVL